MNRTKKPHHRYYGLDFVEKRILTAFNIGKVIPELEDLKQYYYEFDFSYPTAENHSTVDYDIVTESIVEYVTEYIAETPSLQVKFQLQRLSDEKRVAFHDLKDIINEYSPDHSQYFEFQIVSGIPSMFSRPFNIFFLIAKEMGVITNLLNPYISKVRI